MTETLEPDFSGWATKNNLRCSDGRTIRPGAFKHMDKQTVPLVWMHQHNDPQNILGHAVLEDRAFGVYTHGYFNDTERASHMKQSVIHGDVRSLSIYANKLTQDSGKNVMHGDIKEVSLVVAGANPGALIENVAIMHGSDFEEIMTEAIIFTGDDLEFIHMDTDETEDLMARNEAKHADRTVKDVIDEMTDEQREAMKFVVGAALEEADKSPANADTEAKHDDLDEDVDILDGDAFLAHINNTIKESVDNMTDVITKNIFEGGKSTETANDVLAHADFSAILKDAKRPGSTLMDALEHADYGIQDIDILFPDAKNLDGTPQFWSRRMEWVSEVLNGVRRIPFSNVRTTIADITADEARAKGYVKGTKKKDEIFSLLKRTTGPATIYKKNKLDRDDILDIVDLDVVSWLKGEIRLMLEEETARAILIGDGRAASSPDKIKDPMGANDGVGIRSILHDDDFYAHTVELAANVEYKDLVKEIVRSRLNYRGSGRPTLFISETTLTELLLLEDKFGRALYDSVEALATKLRVAKIVEVGLFDTVEGLLSIMVNLGDYGVGANKGGEITAFEAFDIDFNQQKYLLETRISGALTMPKAAVVLKRVAGEQVAPVAPTFNGPQNMLSIPTVTGVVYLVDGEPETGDVRIEHDVEVVAKAANGYYLTPNTTKIWSFTYTQH